MQVVDSEGYLKVKLVGGPVGPFVPYTGATGNVDLGTHTLSAKDIIVNHASGSGVAVSITKGGAGEALTITKTSGSGNAMSVTGGNVEFGTGFFWDSNNNRLGIGTSTPAQTFQVYRNTSAGYLAAFNSGATLNTNASLTVRIENANLPSLQALNPGAGAFNTFALNPLGGNILIGTTTDAGFKLDVNGTARVTTLTTTNLHSPSGTETIFIKNSGGTTAARIFPDGSTFRISSASGANTLGIYNSGNVGINTTTDAGFRLDVNGTARVNTLTIGLGTGQVATNSVFGFQALNANTIGSQNTAVGYQSMLANTTGVNNAAFGYQSMLGSTTGSDNTAFGYVALSGINTGNSNTAIGNRAMIGNNTGSFNTAVGRSALNINTSGLNNTAIGYNTLRLNLIGQDNVAVGSNALSASTGDVNTAVGSGAMSANTTGQFNTAIGTSALNANTTGSGNTAVGFSTQTGNFNNSVILGWGATATASNQFVIGTAARNAGAVTTEVNASTQVWNVIINGVARKILLA